MNNNSIKYKNTNNDFVPQIPENWELRKIKFASSLQSGFAFKSSEYSEEGYPVFRIGDILDEININNCPKYPIAKSKSLVDFRVYNGDILIALTGATIGKTALIKNLENFGLLNQRVAKLEKPTKFLYYSFLSKPIQEQIKLISNGSAQENISNKTIENFYIPFPSADQQVAIANFLDKKCEQINQFIADKKQLINLLKEQRQSVIDEILIPNSDTWVFTRLKNIVEINKNVLPENTSKNYDLQYIDIGNVDSNGNIAQLQQLKFGNAPSRARRIVKYNDILISTVRTYLRAITINKKSDENIICSTGYAVLQTNELILPELLIEILRSERFISKVVSNSVGVSYPAITPTALGTLELAYPKDINVQNEIIAKIKSETKFIDETIFKTEEELRLVAEYKEALISNAVTGQLHIA